MTEEKTGTKNKRNENNKRDCITTLYACFVIIAVVAIIIMVASIDSLGDTTKVMGLVGILATFVVISNYAQMVEIRNKTDEKMDWMKNELDDLHKQLDQFENLSERIESNYIVDINRVKLAISKTETDERIIELLNELTVYRDLNASAIRWKIIEVLNSIHDKSAKSEAIASEVMSIGFSLAPMGEKNNEVLADVLMTGYYLIEDALKNDEPKNGLYGFEIVKWVLMITKNYDETIKDLQQLKTKFPEMLKKKYLDALIEDLNQPVMGFPMLTGELKKYVYGEDNN